jgi:hypothetical protein
MTTGEVREWVGAHTARKSPDLAVAVEAWPSLPEPIRAAIGEMIRATQFAQDQPRMSQ